MMSHLVQERKLAKPAARIEFSLANGAPQSQRYRRDRGGGILVAWLTVAALAYVWVTGQKIDSTWLYPPGRAAGAATNN